MLTATHLAGFGLGRKYASAIFAAENRSSTDASSYNLGSYSLASCPERSDRIIVAACYQRNSTFATITLGGTDRFSSIFHSSGATSWTWIAYPTGTTITVALTTSGTALNAGVGLWAVYGMGSAPRVVDSDGTPSDTNTAQSVTVDVAMGGVVLAARRISNATNRTQTWDSPLTENWDTLLESGLNQWSGASYSGINQQGQVTVTSTASGTIATNGQLSVVSLR